jgi:hypothetical protein
MSSTFTAPVLAQDRLLGQVLDTQGFAVLSAEQVVRLAGASLPDMLAWRNAWNDLPPDAYLRDGGRYRRRRHSCFVVRNDAVTLSPQRPHWQPVQYNALHGGLQRHFEPMLPDLVAQHAWSALLVWLAQVASVLRGAQPWYVEAHQFRIDTTDGIGRPTPEGAHRDGVDLVAVFLVDRSGVKGGETRVFDADGPQGQRFTLTEPWSVLLLDDARVIHESTPIQPLQGQGHRDTLVITLRSVGFQGDDALASTAMASATAEPAH